MVMADVLNREQEIEALDLAYGVCMKYDVFPIVMLKLLERLREEEMEP